MGGQAFTHPGPNGEPALNTPRMPPVVYSSLRSHYAAILQSFYEHVATPAEGPGKADFGDIDFIVSSPITKPADATINGKCDTETGLLATALNAKRSIHDSPTTSNFAVPIPTTPAAADTATDIDEHNATYAQIDVHVCSAHLFTWTVFFQSYADLGQILGLMIRPHGLTATHEGLFARVPEIENASAASGAGRTKSFLFLTRDPAATMAFLGLDEAAYDAGFCSEEEVFAWTAACRLFSRAAFAGESRTARDRQRVRTRGMYRRFLTEWLAGAAAEAMLHEPIGRGVVFRDAVAYFDVQDEYERMVVDFEAEQKENEFWRTIAEVVPLQDERLNLTVRGLRRWVRFEESSSALDGPAVPVIAAAPEMDREKQANWTADGRPDVPQLLAWVLENWEEVKLREQERAKRDVAIRKLEREAARETTSAAENNCHAAA